MPFNHPGLEAARTRLGRPVPVGPIATARTWKVLVCLVALARFILVAAHPFFQATYMVLAMATSKLFPALGARLEPVFAALSAAFIIKVPAEFYLFWLYYLCFDTGQSFEQDYTEVWRQKFVDEGPGTQYSIHVFINNGDRMEVPCREDGDDQLLLRTISAFYYVRKAEKGLLEVMSLKSLRNIEIVKLEGSNAVGAHQEMLMLGRYRTSFQYTYYFRNPSEMQGTMLVGKLRQLGVITTPWQQKMALNFVSSFNSRLASVMVLFPLLSSLLFAIVWPAVAVRKYNADVQASVQTGFSAASYVVTTGALIIALIAFLETRYATPRASP